jgi:hypothetical protein
MALLIQKAGLSSLLFHQSDLDTILAEAMTSTSFAACADAVRSSFHVRTIR